MKTKTIIITLAGAVALACAGAFAQDTGEEPLSPGKRGPRPDREAMQARHEQILAIYDEDKDGRLDDVEREVLKADIDAGKIEAPFGGRGRRGAGGPAGMGPGGRQGPPAGILEQYDANDDGVLDATEHAAIRADIESGKLTPPGRPQGARGPGRRGPPPEILEQYDANGDGVLDATEHAAVRADIESGKLTPPERPQGARGPGRRGPPPEILEQYDANGDGVLDATEHAAVRADIESGKLTPPARPQGARPPG